MVPKISRRLRGTARNTKIPTIAAHTAASSHNIPGPFGFGENGAAGTIFARDEVSKLDGTVTVNDVLVPPGNCASTVLTPTLTPVPELGVQITSEFGLKFVPFTVSVTFAPVFAVVGEIELNVGTGPSTLKFNRFCAPVTDTAATVGFAIAAVGTVAVI